MTQVTQTNPSRPNLGSPGKALPLQRAQEIVAGMCQSAKDAHWFGIRMENFEKEFGRRMETVTDRDICDHLERLMQRGQADWQVKQSLEAIEQ